MKTTFAFPSGLSKTTHLPIDVQVNHTAVYEGEVFRIVGIRHILDAIEFERIVQLELA